MPTTALTPQQRRLLRARAHALQPVVQIAAHGLGKNVLAEIERSLQAHELIKIKTRGAAREQRQQWLQQICRQLQAQAVQHIGNTFVIWRQRREENTTPAATSSRPASNRTTAKPPRRRLPPTTTQQRASERYRPARANPGARRVPAAPRRRASR